MAKDASTIDLESQYVKSQLENAVTTMKPLTDEEICQIEIESRGQASNEKWFYHRKGINHKRKLNLQ